MEFLIGIIVAVLAIGFVGFVIVKSIIDKKNGKTCCSDCLKCNKFCNYKQIDK